MLDVSLLFEHFFDDIKVLASKIFPCFGQLKMEVEQVSFQLIHLALLSYFHCASVETDPLLDRFCKLSYDNLQLGLGLFLTNHLEYKDPSEKEKCHNIIKVIKAVSNIDKLSNVLQLFAKFIEVFKNYS